MSDSLDIASAFNKTAKTDNLRNFADSFQALYTQTILFNNKRLDKVRSLSGHLFPASGAEVDDNSLTRGLVKFFFEMKKTLWKVGLVGEECGEL